VLPWGVRGYNDILSVGASRRREFQQAARDHEPPGCSFKSSKGYRKTKSKRVALTFAAPFAGRLSLCQKEFILRILRSRAGCSRHSAFAKRLAPLVNRAKTEPINLAESIPPPTWRRDLATQMHLPM